MLPEGPRRASKVLRVGSKSLNGPQLLPCLVIRPDELFLLDEVDDIIPEKGHSQMMSCKEGKGYPFLWCKVLQRENSCMKEDYRLSEK